METGARLITTGQFLYYLPYLKFWKDHQQSSKYLESNLLLSTSQCGFRCGLSTIDAIHDLTDFIITKVDSNKKVIAVFIDLAKAFDMVSVPLLSR